MLPFDGDQEAMYEAGRRLLLDTWPDPEYQEAILEFGRVLRLVKDGKPWEAK